ncbi:hypothetical protein SAMN02746065_10488 [Desulfocicer vacuolatum DSM 3385]|uniref:Uncharacterized protein n=1 Tax=Desulfocicer vacuolatum DSM 3385 TaxID=1121400 RepID=A0A1W2A3Z5_9BACT|nr:hypothetical protein [Desulfocicer vacuolatum]SMC55395.1 hypothetical protein SAMN02746065_10488 [Desulfocicer vacuolatum DSM 3385]
MFNHLNNRAKTIRPLNGIYQCNTRIDHQTHERLKYLKAYYDKSTGLSTNTGVVVRRAIELLIDHIDSQILKERSGAITNRQELASLDRCAKGSEGQRRNQYHDPGAMKVFPTFRELQKVGKKPYEASDYEGKSINR